MSFVRRTTVLLLVFGAVWSISGCQDQAASAEKFQWLPIYGDFNADTSPVVAKVGDIALTERMIKLFIDELPPRLKNQYLGPDGNRLALKQMIDQALLAQGAVDLKLYNDSDVARQLISQRRNTLDYAMRNYGLLRGNEPGEEDIRKFFEDNKQNYRQQGLTMSRHVECLTEADAKLAYQRIMTGERKNDFLHVVNDMSINETTRKDGGNTGWFATGGFIPGIEASEIYATRVSALEMGLHPPIRVKDRWHVVEVTHREYERPMTFGEAKDKVKNDMLPGWQDAVIKDYLISARGKTRIEMLGEYAPGKGAKADELFARAMAMKDNGRKLDLLALVVTDFPQSERADDALFMSANLAIELWQDLRVADRYLTQLITDYPQSELVDDATFLRENLYNPNVLNPKSIEDLKSN